MEKVLNTLSDKLIILDKLLNVKFCNTELLKVINISKDEINRIKVSTSNRNLINEIYNDEIKEKEISFHLNGQYIKLYGNIVLQEELIFMIVKDIIGVASDIPNDVIQENLEQNTKTVRSIVLGLEEVIRDIESNKYNFDIKKEKNMTNLIKEALNQIKGIELMQQDFELFLSVSSDMIGVLDEEYNLKMVDENWNSYLGWEKEDIMGKNIVHIIHEEDKKEFEDMINGLGEQIKIIENKVKCKNGKFKYFRWNLKFCQDASAIVFTIRDISKEKQEQQIKIELEKEIQMESLKSEYLTNMSHEFRTPINIILGVIQLMECKIDKSKIVCTDEFNIKEYIKTMKQNSYRLLKLVNNIIDITKIDTGGYKLDLGNYNIVNVVEEISLSVVNYVKERNINIIFDTNSEEEIIACDPEKIERILLNLLSNAIKNTEDNGSIYVNVEVSKDLVNIVIRDTGQGISEDKINKIFDRFEQADKSLRKGYQGSGIGLSLVKSLVNMHGGNISVSSEVGVGSEFNIQIPKNIIEIQKNPSTHVNTSDRVEMCNIEFSDIYK